MANCYIDPCAPLSWDALFPYVLPYVLGVPDELMAHHIRLACIEFCRRSGISHDENVFDLQAGVDTYFLKTLCDYQIIRIYEVDVLHRWVYKPTIRKPLIPWHWTAFGFWMENIDVIHMSRPVAQDITEAMRVEFVVAPTQDGCCLDNYLYESWAEGIAFGAIHRLSLIPNTGWYNLNQAQIFGLKFRNEIARARTAVDLNFTSGPLVMQGERFI